MIVLREFREADWAALWPFMHAIVEAGETFPYDRGLDADGLRAIWLLPPPGRVIVAATREGAVVGTAHMQANRGGPGAHVATASFMVDPAHGGHGIGRALGEEVLRWARARHFKALQFNAVVETNEPAVHLWQALGLRIVGTVPEAHDHPELGLVGVHVMHRFL